MPIVFVHGVAVRASPEYRQREVTRDAMFCSMLGGGKDVAVFNPYWGGCAAKFRWGMASLPQRRLETFGSDAVELRARLAETAEIEPADGRTLLNVARIAFPAAVDALWVASAEIADERSAHVLASGAAAVAEFIRKDSSPAWLDRMQNDDQLVERLAEELKPDTQMESFGGAGRLGDVLSEGLSKLAHNVATVPVAALRPMVNEAVTRFIGDVFTYLNTRGTREDPGSIIKIVLGTLRDADAQRKVGDDQLIVVGHSMGGNIVYDILTYFAPDLQCNAFVTVGSQVGLFEELGLFCASDRTLPHDGAQKVPKPANVARWLNVVDRVDILSYVTEPIFGDTSDYEFVSSPSPLAAHGSYFARPLFFDRLRERLRKESA